MGSRSSSKLVPILHLKNEGWQQQKHAAVPHQRWGNSSVRQEVVLHVVELSLLAFPGIIYFCLASRHSIISVKRANVLCCGWKIIFKMTKSGIFVSRVVRICSVYLVYFTPEEMEPVWSPAWGVPALVPRCPRQPGHQGCSQCSSLQEARPAVRHKHSQISPDRSALPHISAHLPSPTGETAPPLPWNGCPRSPAASGWSASGEREGGGVVRLDRATFQDLQSERDGGTFAGRLMASQSGDGNSSFPLRIWSNSSSCTLFSLGRQIPYISCGWIIISLPVRLPPKWREPAQQDVGDHSRSPDVHLQTIPTHMRTQGLACSSSTAPRFKPRPGRFSPRLSDDLWRHVGGRATHGVQRPLHYRRQAKVAQLQWFGAVWILTHLQHKQSPLLLPSSGESVNCMILNLS